MIEVQISTRGLDFTAVADNLNSETKAKLVERLAEVAYYEAFYNAPWRTGKLARSIVMEIVEAGQAKIKVLAPYAIYVITGTKPHTIRPVSASCLAFKVAGGGMVFTKYVRHPGTKPNPFLEQAAEAAYEQIDEVWDDLYSELVEGATN